MRQFKYVILASYHKDNNTLNLNNTHVELGSDLYDAGYLNITNIDISTVVINQMTDMYRAKEEMEFSTMDARRMEFIPDQCFDLVLDKGNFCSAEVY